MLGAEITLSGPQLHGMSVHGLPSGRIVVVIAATYSAAIAADIAATFARMVPPEQDNA